jgi:hypothetical protein
MRRSAAAILPAIVLVAAAACATHASLSDPSPLPARIRWGWSFGWCVGYCAEVMQLERGRIRVTQWPSDRSQPRRMSERHLADAEWRALLEGIEQAGIDALPDRIGCPDCADGGAEFVELERGTTKKRVTFDYGGGPPELHAVLKELRALRQRFAAR